MADALIDTTAFIDYYRRDRGAEALFEMVMTGRMAASYSAMTVVELWRGRMDRAEELIYEGALGFMEEAVITGRVARVAGQWLRPLEESVKENTIRDALIAATALERGEIIYTRNVRDFRRFYAKVRSY